MTRQSRGLQVVNSVFKAIMAATAIATAVVGGLGAAGIAGASVGVFSALAVTAGTSAAIPVVGWCVAAAIVIATCIYAMTVFFKGQDRNFSLVFAKGKDGQLILPMWGKEYYSINEKDIPTYVNPNIEKIENMLMCAGTRIYGLYKSATMKGSLVEGSRNIRYEMNKTISIKVKGMSLGAIMPNVTRYLNLAAQYGFPDNNFKTSKKLDAEFYINLPLDNISDSNFPEIIKTQMEAMKEDAEYVSEITKGMTEEQKSAGIFVYEATGEDELDKMLGQLAEYLRLADPISPNS